MYGDTKPAAEQRMADAAPEMYAALKAIAPKAGWIEGCDCEDCVIWRNAADALAKAEGK